MSPVRMIAWDFDGVLNRNTRDGKLIWHLAFEADLGLPLARFQDYVFRSGRFGDVLVGARDLRELLAEWLATEGDARDPAEIMAYWFEKDAHPCPETIALMVALPVTHVIATNNETHRAAYMEGPMGFGPRVAKLFASGRMGVKKPDPAFFRHIEREMDVEGEEVLLIDDSKGNCDAAAALGWRVYHLTDASRPGLAATLAEATEA